MIVAVTYDNGLIFQHFGKTKDFLLCDVENGEIKSTRVLSCGEAGHEALADLIKENGAEVLILGGLGQGARDHLNELGIKTCAGNTGDALEAVKKYLKGELAYNDIVTCDHHDHDHEHEHHHNHVKLNRN